MAADAPWARVTLVGADGTQLRLLLVGDGAPDLAVVEGLARLQLAAGRAGLQMHLEDVCGFLEALLDLSGLSGQVGGQTEGREQVRIQEGMDPGDPVA
jgi:hypothetical protein